MAPRAAVVGAGISGVSAARALTARGVEVVVLDRGHRIGGRMATRTLRGTGLPYDGRVVDVGAAYLTADDPGFQDVVDQWVADGVARPWTDTFLTGTLEGIGGSTTGPVRYAAPAGLRSLVEDLAADLTTVVNPRDVSSVQRDGSGVLVDGERFDAVVLAMPDAQVRDLVSDDDPVQGALGELDYLPVLSLTAAYAAHRWPEMDGVFVNDNELISFVAEDGRRRGDGAPVLVVQSRPELAARHLDDPTAAAPEMLAALRSALDVPSPAWFEVKRWALARPDGHREEPFALVDGIGVCGDGWGAAPRIQTAWVSGRRLGEAVAAYLGA
ncbi:MAG: NAD(P)/FAD-dependent oxidoreductase [Candidatus Nanopelagicales bacterium]